MQAQGQAIMLTEKWYQFDAGWEGTLLESGPEWSLVELGGAPVEVPSRILAWI